MSGYQLLTPTTIEGVKRLAASVRVILCVCVCLFPRTIKPKLQSPRDSPS